ncbi:MAG: hypothetical protein OEW58_07985, partial [Gammaproteobacteria bacterium]|nr:hypothetical protein [Gammaproteobacteria bacterium]
MRQRISILIPLALIIVTLLASWVTFIFSLNIETEKIKRESISDLSEDLVRLQNVFMLGVD